MTNSFNHKGHYLFFSIFFSLTLFVLSMTTGTASAQAPQAIPYQAVARDNTGATLANQAIALRLSIHNTTATGTIVYQETQTTTTNSLGLFNLNIGQGTAITGTLSGVNWANGSKFIQVEMDPTGGTSYTDMGTTQLMSVPYALSSADNQWTKSGNNISSSNSGNVGIGTSTPDAKLTIAETNTGISSTIINLSNNAYYLDCAASIELNNSYFDQSLSFINKIMYPSSFTSNAFNFIAYPPTIYGWGNTPSTIMTMQHGGNIGIGTSPTTKLDVNGQVKIRGGSPGAGKVLTSDANGLATWQTPTFTETDPRITCYTNYAVPRCSNNWWYSPTLVDGIITDNGSKVGIGNSYPSAKLDINGNIRISGGNPGVGKILTSDATGVGSWLNEADPKVTSTTTHKIPKWNGTTLIDGTIADVGSNIGIGTTTPSAKLDINGTIKVSGGNPGAGKVLTSDSTGLASWISIASLTESDPGISCNTINKMPKWNGTTLIDGIVTDDGTNIGIGTSTPVAKLDINGTIKISGGNPAAGKVLTADATGLASWQTPAVQSETDPKVSSTTSNKIPKWNGTTLVDGVIADDGTNIGIGTTAPGAKLHVNGIIRAQADVSNKAIELYKSNGTAGWEMYVNNTGLSFCEQGIACDRLFVATGGNVGIGTATPAQKLSVSGNICYTGSIGACSDFRYKKNISPLKNSLSQVLLMQGVYYNWKVSEFPDKQFTDQKQIGFIAQDLEKLYPELVITDANGYKSVDYSKVTPILVEAIKELSARNEKLELECAAKLASLEAKLNLILQTTVTAQK